MIARFKTEGKKTVTYWAQHSIKFPARVFAVIAIFTYLVCFFAFNLNVLW